MSTITPTNEELYNEIREYVARAVDFTPAQIIISNSNMPRPNGMYGTVYILTESTDGLPKNSINGQSTLIKNIKVSVQFYRNNAVDHANTLFLYLTSRQKDWIKNKYITYVNNSEVRDLTGLVTNNYEQRASIDINFKYEQTVIYPYKSNIIDVSIDNKDTGGASSKP